MDKTLQSVIFIDVTKSKDFVDENHKYLKVLKSFYKTINEEKYQCIEFIKFIGDRVMLIFNISELKYLLPEIVKIRNGFDKIVENIFIEKSISLKLRIGISCGDLTQNSITYNTQFDYVSPVINRAANLCSTVAKPFGIVIDKESFEDELKDFSNKINDLSFCEDFTAETAGGKRIHYLVENITNEREGVKEIHLTGFIFNDGKLLLEKRNKNEILDPNKLATPGGRMIRPAPFDKALKDMMLEDTGLSIKNIELLDTYYIEKFKAPGICFYAETDSLEHIKPNMSFYSEKDILNTDIMQNINRNTISKSFKKNKINLPINYRVRIVLPHSCNFNCINCHKEHIVNNTLFNLVKTEELLDILSSEKCNLFHVTITGGEPFYKDNYKYLLELLTFIRDKYGNNLEISIVTNGYEITKEKLEEIQNHNVSLKISLYSIDRGNDTPMHYIGKKDIPSSTYFSKILDTLELVNNYNIEKSLNILINENDEVNGKEESKLISLIKLLKDKNIKLKNIKLMEQVPAIDDSTKISVDKLKIYDEYNENLTEIVGFEKTKSSMTLHGFNVIFFKYPCCDPNNCSQCFEKWDLIISSSGNLQVCSRTADEPKYKHRLYSVPKERIKYVNYREMYVEK